MEFNTDEFINNIYHNHILKKFNSVCGADKITQNDIYVENEKTDKINLEKYLKSFRLTETKLKYYKKMTKTTKYIYWSFHYDGHQDFYILFDNDTKYYYAIFGGGDGVNEQYSKKLYIGCIDLDEEGRYWMDIYKSQYLEDIINLIK